MFVSANIKFHFDFTASEEEYQDIIQTGEFFPENVIDCEVIFDE